MSEYGVGLGKREVAVREARRENRPIATLRCIQQGISYLVECEVYPVSGLRAEPLRPGPYTFARLEDANSFLDEAVQALLYLGCDVSH